MNRACQRQTQVFDFPVRAMIAPAPAPSVRRTTIRARQTCLCGEDGAEMIVSRRCRSDAATVKGIPVRIPMNRTASKTSESTFGLLRANQSTSSSDRCKNHRFRKKTQVIRTALRRQHLPCPRATLNRIRPRLMRDSVATSLIEFGRDRPIAANGLGHDCCRAACQSSQSSSFVQSKLNSGMRMHGRAR